MNKYRITIPNILDTFVFGQAVCLIKDITMDKNKRERDANGRFVKSTEPKKQENKKSPCEKPDYEKKYNALNSALKYALEENRTMKEKIERLTEELYDKIEEENVVKIVFRTQKIITNTIIKRLNWFQRRKLRKILNIYPDTFGKYILEKNV